MIRKHPGRVLGVIALAALILLGLGYPGRNGDVEGAWKYISGLSWIGFCLLTIVFLVLSIYALATRKSRKALQQ
jgi:hypothetical protein